MLLWITVSAFCHARRVTGERSLCTSCTAAGDKRTASLPVVRQALLSARLPMLLLLLLLLLVLLRLLTVPLARSAPSAQRAWLVMKVWGNGGSGGIGVRVSGCGSVEGGSVSGTG